MGQMSSLWAGIVITLGALALVASLRRLRGLSRRRLATLGLLRGVVVIALALVAADAGWVSRRQVLRPRTVLVALDCSASMDLPDMPGGKTRRQALRALFLRQGGLLDKLASSRPVEVYCFSDLLIPLGERALPAGGPATDLLVALQQLHAEAARSDACGIILASDGVDTEGLSPAYAARQARGLPPIFAVPLGGRAKLANRKVLGLSCPRQVHEGDLVTVKVTASSSRPEGSDQTSAGVKGQWSTSLGTSGDFSLTPEARGRGRATFSFKATKAGRQRVLVRLEKGPEEVTEADNAAMVTFDVLPAERRLVYLDGHPRPEAATLRRLLGRLKETKVTVAIREAPGRWWQQVPTLRGLGSATEAEGFDRATAYVLGDLSAKDLPDAAWRTIQARVRAAASALLVLGGERSAELPGQIQQLLPARLGTYRASPILLQAPSITPPLDLDATLWRSVPALPGLNGLGSPTAGAQAVVRSRSGEPVLVLRDEVEVRSAVLATDGLYRWVLSASADDLSKAAYRDLVLKLTAWLLSPRPARPVTLELNRLTALQGDSIIARATVRPGIDKVRGQVRQGKNVVATLSLERLGRRAWHSHVPPLKPGDYVLRVQAYSQGHEVGRDELPLRVLGESRERRWPGPDETMLAALAQATGGRVVAWQEAGKLPQLLPGKTQSVWQTRRREVGRGLGVGLLILLLLSADWVLRRRWGLM